MAAQADALPTFPVRFTDLEILLPLSEQQSSRGLPTVGGVLAGAALSLPRALARAGSSAPPAPTKTLPVLSRCSSTLLPGRLTLLLGHPGSGKSTLLKALTHRLAPPASTHLVGEVLYGGLTAPMLRERGLHLCHLAQYVSQLDEHFPFLTVRETLQFAADCLVAPEGGASAAATARARVDATLSALHLTAAANTLIGNDLVRGVSGGEKKRVTIGEGLLTGARFLALDEISTGLDSSTTFEVISRLRERAVESRAVVVVALLQPTPEVYSLFDDVLLQREGAVVFHGERSALPGYLRGLGFLPPRAGEGLEDEADWLAEFLTFPGLRHGKDVEREQAAGGAAGGGDVGLPLEGGGAGAPLPPPPEKAAAERPGPPLTTPALVAAWEASPLRAARDAVAAAAEKAATFELTTPASRAQYGRAHQHSSLEHLGILVGRQFKLMARNKFFLGFRVFSALFMSVVFGGLYYQGGVGDGLNKFGLFLNCCMHLAFANISEMSGAVDAKYIGYRQVANGAHPAWTFPVAMMIAHVPLAIAESLAFGVVAYSMAGMTLEVGRFFFFFLCIFLCDVFSATLFRTFAFSAPTLIAAQAGPLPIIALLIMFCGFMVLKSKMGWMTFLFYIDVFAWAIQSIAINEFSADRYAVAPALGTPCPPTSTLGSCYLALFDFESSLVYKWAGVGFALGATLLVALWSLYSFACVRFDRNVGSARYVDEPLAPTPRSSLASLPRLGSGGGGGGGEGAAPSALELTVAPPAASAASVLPFAPLPLAFRGLTYTVRLPSGEERPLLRGISGYARPGRMLALMGASGAGKTTLLDVLGGRKNSGTAGGSITLNGFPKDSRTFNRVAAYVEQNDMHMPLQTVREAIEFSAALRLPSEVPAATRAAFVDEVMAQMELTHLADAKVGDPGEKDSLSPGERKRLTIGVELAANAPVLFLDEPTSGLDARAAAVVMRVIRNVASTGRTVICTVHQPSAELFFFFDDLLLLQRGGWQVFFGPLGRRAGALVEYLRSLPNCPPYPAGFNPASWMLDVLAGTNSSGDGSGSGGGAAPPGEGLQAALFASPQWAAAEKELNAAMAPTPGAAPLAFPSPFASSAPSQFAALLRRSHLTWVRNIPMNLGRIGAITFLMTLYGIIYLKIADSANDYQGVRTLVAAIFMTAAFSAMLNMDASMPTLLKMRPPTYREKGSLMSVCRAPSPTLQQKLTLLPAHAPPLAPTLARRRYGTLPNVLSMLIVELPWLALCVTIGTSISYFMMGLAASAVPFFTHLFTVFLLALVLVSFGHTVANTAANFDVAQACIGTFAPILFLFGGMFSKPTSMPAGARWVNTVDPIGYAFRALMPLHFYCTGASCPAIPVAPNMPGIDRWQFVKDQYDLSYDDVWPCIGYLSLFIAAFQMFNLGAQSLIKHQTR